MARHIHKRERPKSGNLDFIVGNQRALVDIPWAADPVSRPAFGLFPDLELSGLVLTSLALDDAILKPEPVACGSGEGHENPLSWRHIDIEMPELDNSSVIDNMLTVNCSHLIQLPDTDTSSRDLRGEPCYGASYRTKQRILCLIISLTRPLHKSPPSGHGWQRPLAPCHKGW